MKSSDPNDWGSCLQPSEKQFLLQTAQNIALLVKNQKKMRRFRARLTEFAEKWKAYRIAHEAEQEGKWQPSMGIPENPLRAIWPSGHKPGHFPDYPRGIPTILGDYAILGVIHNRVLHDERINDACLPVELEEEIWLNLVTGRCEESRGIDTSPGVRSEPTYTIPEDRLSRCLDRVKADLAQADAKRNRPEQPSGLAVAVVPQVEVKDKASKAEGKQILGDTLNLGIVNVYWRHVLQWLGGLPGWRKAVAILVVLVLVIAIPTRSVWFPLLHHYITAKTTQEQKPAPGLTEFRARPEKNNQLEARGGPGSGGTGSEEKRDREGEAEEANTPVTAKPGEAGSPRE